MVCIQTHYDIDGTDHKLLQIFTYKFKNEIIFIKNVFTSNKNPKYSNSRD